MSLFDGYDITTSGMSAQRTRINVISANIANAKTTHGKDGGPYVKQNVVFKEMTDKPSLISERLNELTYKWDKKYADINFVNKDLKGVEVKEISDTKTPATLKYEPNHPDANEEGYVAYPNINPVIEMVDLIESMRSYDANVSAFRTQKQLDTATLDILKG
jgi:flagellar basal-body rod protein FlgC